MRESEGGAGFIPELSARRTVCQLADHLRGDAVEDDDARRLEHGQYLRDDFFQTAAVTADEDGIGAGERCDVGLEKIADVDVDARGTEATGVLLDDGLALRSDLETAYLQMRELQTGLDGDAARAETDVPEHLSGSQIEGLEGQQADGHLGNHLLAAVE